MNTIKKVDTLENYVKSLSGLKGLDMGCAVDFGAFTVELAGEEDVKLWSLHNGSANTM